MSWVTPIYDRTAADVTYAKANRSNESYNKGALNPGYDLNRIEGNCKYLADLLNGYGYSVSITTKTDWTDDEFPFLADLTRIKQNVDSLIEAYHEQGGTAAWSDYAMLTWAALSELTWADISGIMETPSSMQNPTYTGLNAIEEILYSINEMIALMVESFRYSGSFYSGQSFNF